MNVLQMPIKLKQTYWLKAQGDDIAFSITMIHGQDHLMTTLLLKI